eukprot:s1207_g2.t1
MFGDAFQSEGLTLGKLDLNWLVGGLARKFVVGHWEPALRNLASEPCFGRSSWGAVLRNLFFGTLLENLFSGRCFEEIVFGNLACRGSLLQAKVTQHDWDPVLGNLAWGACLAAREPCLGTCFETLMKMLGTGSLAWEPCWAPYSGELVEKLSNLACLGAFSKNLFLGTLLRFLGSLFLSTLVGYLAWEALSWKLCLEPVPWNPLPKNLSLGTLRGNSGNPDFGCPDMPQNLGVLRLKTRSSRSWGKILLSH